MFAAPPLDQIFAGDCFVLLEALPARCIDAVITDLPYGTTYAPWDCALSLPRLWENWKRVLKPKGVVVLTASQPFTSQLVCSNRQWFRCEWIWNKVHAANFPNAKRQPLKVHESVLVFAEQAPEYHPQKTVGARNHSTGKSQIQVSETRLMQTRAPTDLSGMKYPTSIQTFAKHTSQCGLHPTQKPLDLLRYFIRTYTSPGDLVLDHCCGCGSTCAAAKIEGRHYIGGDQEQKYAEIAAEFCRQAAPDNTI